MHQGPSPNGTGPPCGLRSDAPGHPRRHLPATLTNCPTHAWPTSACNGTHTTRTSTPLCSAQHDIRRMVERGGSAAPARANSTSSAKGEAVDDKGALRLQTLPGPPCNQATDTQAALRSSASAFACIATEALVLAVRAMSFPSGFLIAACCDISATPLQKISL